MTRPTWIGQTLGGRYRIDDILGQGGMSAVYKAFDPNLKRVVAVKMIHAHLADDPKFLVRFEEEAAAVAQLRHPNIVQVFDFNHDKDNYYMVQEFVAGETLQDRLRRLNRSNRHMPLDEAIGYIINICDAANYAHKRGLVHRDIKPANIMIDIHGQAILMDFGIVKITGGERHTATGAVVGTALYLAPEAIRGETPDPRSDQYALGVTLFEAVSGRPPFEADSAMTLMMMHLNDTLPDLRQLRPGVPAALIPVIERALAKSPEQRFVSMSAFAEALRGVLATLDTAPVVTVAEDAASPDEKNSIPLPLQNTPPPVAPPIQTTAPPPVVPSEQSTPPPVISPVPLTPPTPASMDYTLRETPTPVPPSIGSTPPPPKPSVTVSQVQQSSSQPMPSVTASQAQQSPSAKQPPASPRKPNIVLWGGIGGVALVVIGGLFFLVIFLVLRGLAGTSNTPAATTAPAATQPAEAAALVATETAALAAAPLVEPSATPTPTITQTSPPTLTPTITPSPTPTIPAGVLYSRINNITVNEAGHYVVDYETFEYTEAVPGQHVHFFFNTVKPEQAGVPGSGPWILYGGPRPFTGYRPIDRPASATQLCVLVANSDHSIQLNSGNCFTLPDVNAAVPVYNDPCLAGPGPGYPTVVQLTAGQVLLVTGISPDEAWWTVENPAQPGQSCWLQRSRSDFSGDLSTLPLSEVPPALEGNQAEQSVQIIGITLDDQGHYVVAFTTSGFTPALPGTHIHFFFDVFATEQLSGMGGNRQMYGGASPFTGYLVIDRPQGATQLCALVANPDHTVIEGSGNCFALP
jgi:serine/threonine-protein kinase